MLSAALTGLGAALALAGVAGLGWIIARARRLARSDATPEAARAELGRLALWNAAAVAGAGLGLSIMIVGLVL